MQLTILFILVWMVGVILPVLIKGKDVGNTMDYAKNNKARIWFLLKILFSSAIGCAIGIFTGFIVTSAIKILFLLAFHYVAPVESIAGIIIILIFLFFPFFLSFQMTNFIILRSAGKL